MENIPKVVMTNPARLQIVSLICQSLIRALLAVKGIPMRQTNSWQRGRFQLFIMRFCGKREEGVIKNWKLKLKLVISSIRPCLGNDQIEKEDVEIRYQLK